MWHVRKGQRGEIKPERWWLCGVCCNHAGTRALHRGLFCQWSALSCGAWSDKSRELLPNWTLPVSCTECFSPLCFTFFPVILRSEGFLFCFSLTALSNLVQINWMKLFSVHWLAWYKTFFLYDYIHRAPGFLLSDTFTIFCHPPVLKSAPLHIDLQQHRRMQMWSGTLILAGHNNTSQ